MKRVLLLLVLMIMTAPTPSQAGNEVIRDLGQACVFGATLFGTASAITSSASVAAGITMTSFLPTGVASAMVGCGLIMVSDIAARAFGRLYDYLTWQTGPPRSSYPPVLTPRLDYRADATAATL